MPVNETETVCIPLVKTLVFRCQTAFKTVSIKYISIVFSQMPLCSLFVTDAFKKMKLKSQETFHRMSVKNVSPSLQIVFFKEFPFFGTHRGTKWRIKRNKKAWPLQGSISVAECICCKKTSTKAAVALKNPASVSWALAFSQLRCFSYTLHLITGSRSHYHKKRF